MKKVAITGRKQAELIDAPMFEPVDNWVVVKVHAAPMCTEYKAFLAGEKNEFLGHEAAGEVVAVARWIACGWETAFVAMPLWQCGECDLCMSGDYIHCQNMDKPLATPGVREGSGTYAQYILKQDWLLPKIPDGVSYQHASLACCGIGPSFGAMQRMDVDTFTTILITGAGPVGLGAVINAKYRGARTIVVESIPYRVERAKELGADVVIDPGDEDALAQVMELTGGRGVDCALDCSGNVMAERFCVDATRRMGQVAFVGECNDDLGIRISPDMIRKGLTLLGSWHYNLTDFPKVMQVIQDSPVIDHLISHVFPMSGIQEAFECSASHETAKIILDPWA